MDNATTTLDTLYFNKLMQAVYDMRQAQNNFFKVNNGHNLKVAIAKEVVVDNMLVELIQAGHIAAQKPVKISNGNLFKQIQHA